MIKGFEFFIYGAFIFVALAYSLVARENRTSDLPPAPPPQYMAEGMLRVRTLAEVDTGRQRAVSTGTAFTINDSGFWLTARHVTQGCSAIALANEEGPLLFNVSRVTSHLGTDLSLMETGSGPGLMRLTHRTPQRQENAFHFGYPQGNPASVQSAFIGRGQFNLGDKDDSPEELIHTEGDLWAEVRRTPTFRGALSGISGGPAVNAYGGVVGVTVGGEPRRGRVITVPPHLIFELIEEAHAEGWQAASSTRSGGLVLNKDNFGRYGDTLRQELSVAKVWCFRGKNDVISRRGR